MKILDREVILRHLNEIEASLAYLKTKKGIKERDILKNIEERFAIERALHLAIQNLIDIGNHILAARNINNVETYADIPLRLAEAHIITEKLARNLVNMAKFRNILVHEYIKMETKRLVLFIKNNLGDFEDFAQAVMKYLKIC